MILVPICRELRRKGRRLLLTKCFCTLGFTCFLIYIAFQFVLYEDPCHGQDLRLQLCSLYAKGLVDGKFCNRICNKGDIAISRCDLENAQDHFVFHTSIPPKAPVTIPEFVVVKFTPDHHKAFNHGGASGFNFSVLYNHPLQGDTTTAFERSLTEYLISKFGGSAAPLSHPVTTINIKALRNRLLNTADTNGDGKVSLAEAKTLWALLRSQEFFVTWLFQDSDQVPRLHGFCGGAFLIEDIPVRHLLKRPKSPSVMDRIFPRRYLWALPSWANRAKIGVGVLEFVAHIDAHDTAGPFFLCGTDETNIGYNHNHDAKFSGNLSMVYSKEMLAHALTSRPCTKATDCRISDHCTSMCDETSHKCTARMTKPNLHLGCHILEEYITEDAPSDSKAELKKLFDRCRNLEPKSDGVDVAPMLLLNELKAFLWKRISNDASV